MKTEPEQAQVDGLTPFSTPFQEELIRLFRLRRDVRRFRRDPLPEADVLSLLEAAHTAPSVGLSQPWRFVRVRRERRQGRGDRLVRAGQRRRPRTPTMTSAGRLYRSLKLAGLREAPEHLLVCCQIDPEQGHGLGRATQPEHPARLRDLRHPEPLADLPFQGRAVGWISILDPEELAAPWTSPRPGAGWATSAWAGLRKPTRTSRNCRSWAGSTAARWRRCCTPG